MHVIGKNQNEYDGFDPVSQCNMGKIRWDCRRGMWELDRIFAYYLDKGFPLTTEEQQTSFARLLDKEDTEIYSWILKQEEPLSEFKEIIETVRECYAKSSDNKLL